MNKDVNETVIVVKKSHKKQLVTHVIQITLQYNVSIFTVYSRYLYNTSDVIYLVLKDDVRY